ncbi:hypothetical protein EBAPG3_003190 [Nitrosospira lacus]|uniref:Uncharacterized protein n=1 Tax=Nitrosospira lacus TaxID=1288494 RepID=A0A1W6SM30_9PROT|nr:hypothetical protein EBAPG3_003190 [Nitrosospira lacus]
MKFTYPPAGTIMLLGVRNSSTAQNSLEHKRTPQNGLPKDASATANLRAGVVGLIHFRKSASVIYVNTV